MPIKISDQARSKLNEWKDDSGEVKLPFEAPVFWVLNGSAQYKPLVKISPALYFGGFASSANEIEMLGVGIAAVKHEFTPRGAEQSIEIYSTRKLLVAPFGKRLSSVEKETGIRHPGYHKGASPHLQIVAYMAEYNEAEKTIVPVCPVVITAKGYQVGNILDALREFSSKTMQARKKYAEGLRAEMFYCQLGTFGDKFTGKMVGGEGKQSPITPIVARLPETIDEKFIEMMFVGENMADELTSLHEQCADWLNAWKEVKTDAPRNSNGHNTNGDSDSVPEAPPEPPSEEGEYPF